MALDPVLVYQIMLAILTKDVAQNALSIQIAYSLLLVYNRNAKIRVLVLADSSPNVKLSIIDLLVHVFPVTVAIPSNIAI